MFHFYCTNDILHKWQTAQMTDCTNDILHKWQTAQMTGCINDSLHKWHTALFVFICELHKWQAAQMTDCTNDRHTDDTTAQLEILHKWQSIQKITGPFLKIQAPMLGGIKTAQKNKIMIFFDTRLILKSNLNWILMGRGGEK